MDHLSNPNCFTLVDNPEVKASLLVSQNQNLFSKKLQIKIPQTKVNKEGERPFLEYVI